MKMKFPFKWPKCTRFNSSKHSSTIAIKGDNILNTLQTFTYDELRTATRDFHSSNKIGKGGFGTVYKGTLKNGKIIAVKVLSLESKQGEKEIMSEISSISRTSHKNVVKLHGGCFERGFRILVYDYMENNSLAQTSLGTEEKREKFSWKARRETAIGIARGLAFIHEDVKPRIVHRDIKASNILLDRNFTPKISDFGLSKLFPDNTTHLSTRVAGTLGYLAPEYAITGHITRKTDVYSFGVLLLEIITGRSAVDFDLEFGEYYLADKAWEMYKRKKLVEMVDPMLKGNFIEEEAIRFLKIGLLCVQEISRIRPHVSTAIKMMKGEIDVHVIQIQQPGLISDIMDVKIGRPYSSQTTESSTSTASPLY